MTTRGTASASAPGDVEALRAHVARVYRLLVAAYGMPPWRPDHDALGGLVATVLSQHTSDANSARAYAELVATFAAWEAVRDAPTEAVAHAIRAGGLARQKAIRIQQILHQLSARAPDAPLAIQGLADLPLDDALAYLQRLPGVGPKTAACVLLFSLGMPAFPVDTHVWRVSRRLGLIGARVSAAAAHVVLRDLIPPEWRYTTHVDFVEHGRHVCHARKPACCRCPLRTECAYYQALGAARP